MSLLDKLWDDTVAGPQPDSGLGRLRRYNTFAAAGSRQSPGGKVVVVAVDQSSGEDQTVKVTRSIMIIKPPGNQTASNGSGGTPPISPAGSTPPVSPFSGLYISGGRSDQSHRFRRRSTSDVFERAGAGAGAGGDRVRSSSPPFDV
ncbi:hypothetical protein Scep_030725 [Stephania cephalantha]|uniref:Uncharacterized protein n=1 Tax=Stephania cephalantha TaxID=152367 RepID=A0AAP0HEL0_9MAGN